MAMADSGHRVHVGRDDRGFQRLISREKRPVVSTSLREATAERLGDQQDVVEGEAFSHGADYSKIGSWLSPICALRRLRRSPGAASLGPRDDRTQPGDFRPAPLHSPGKGEKSPIVLDARGISNIRSTSWSRPSEAVVLGVPAVILFGIPDKKDAQASGAYAADGIVQPWPHRDQESLPGLWSSWPTFAFASTPDHGHCGIIKKNGAVLNDATLELAAKTAVSQAQAGCDVIVPPSGMMDGQVAAIRRALDNEGLGMTPILAYAAKYASAFYGPFRDAAESPPSFGDRSGYQMDPANVREALRETALDVAEGADMVMVKPALAYSIFLPQVRDTLRPADRRLQRLGRVRHDQGRRGQRLDRREKVALES